MPDWNSQFRASLTHSTGDLKAIIALYEPKLFKGCEGAACVPGETDKIG